MTTTLKKQASARRCSPPKETPEEQDARILRRIEAGKRLREVEAKAVKLAELHEELIGIQAQHKAGLQISDKKLRRETLRPIEAVWLERATEWAGLFTEVSIGLKQCISELAMTCPLELLTECNDAHDALEALVDQLEQRQVEAIAGEFPLEKYERLREQVRTQRELFEELNRRVMDPVILV